MAWTLCTSGSAIAKAGANVNTDIVSYDGAYKTYLDNFSDEAEGEVELQTGRTFISSYSSLPAGIQGAVGDVCSSLIAMKMVAFDTTGYLSREADTILNVQDDIITKGLAKLRDFKNIILKSPV